MPYGSWINDLPPTGFFVAVHTDIGGTVIVR
jgi:hypothetical protein